MDEKTTKKEHIKSLNMIPQKIQALFDFIVYLDANKKEYIDKYIPLCDELSKLSEQRNKLKPNKNYKDKQAYEKVQKEIEEKFEPIMENIYYPVTNKLRELGIWSGEADFTSIWNNNISEIASFKKNFTQEDIEKVLLYKQKYLQFRSETNSNFLTLQIVFYTLDEVYKEIFDFFKDTDKNEFDNFETKTVKAQNLVEIDNYLKNNTLQNVVYSIPLETNFEKKPEVQTIERNKTMNIYYMENNTTTNFSNNKDTVIIGDDNRGTVIVGNDNVTEVNSTDKVQKKSFRWQKTDTILSTIIGILGLLLTYYLSIKN